MKITRRKTVAFTLEQDGFSLHTFEISHVLNWKNYQSIMDYLKVRADNWYRCKNGTLCFYCFSKHGVRINLTAGANKCNPTMYMIINPRKLLNPDSSYLGILVPEKASIKKIDKRFTQLFENTPIPCKINQYLLNRVDLCVNMRIDNKKIFRELIRVLRKLPTPSGYERSKKKAKYPDDKQEAKKIREYNKHYLCYKREKDELVIYDKLYQMENESLRVGYEKLPEGLLRAELHCSRRVVWDLQKETRLSKPLEQLTRLMEESEERLMKAFHDCFHKGIFLQYKELEKRISQSSFKQKTKETMLQLCTDLRKKQSVDKALTSLEAKGAKTDRLLKKFHKLGISPVPLWENFMASELPGPIELLEAVAHKGEYPVEYIITKQK